MYQKRGISETPCMKIVVSVPNLLEETHKQHSRWGGGEIIFLFEKQMIEMSDVYLNQNV
jgi:hypothetical protein